MLPDILAPNLDVIFCGTAAGNRSAQLGHYYAGRGNSFWKTLATVGLTPRLLAPEEDRLLLQFRIGLTDLAKSASGMDRDIPESAFIPERLAQIVSEYAPRAVAFNGKKAAKLALAQRGSIPLGRHQHSSFPNASVWILPSTSGAARGYFNLRTWADFAAFLNS